MIESLKKEIFDLERVLETKKAELSNLMDCERFKNKNQLIAIVEMHDQFYGIHSVELVENDIDNISAMKARYSNLMYCFEVRFFKAKDLKEDFDYLQEMIGLSNVGEDAIIDWMQENEEITF